jgi:hypothetical protein
VSEIEVLSGVAERDYYLKKIESFKQDLRDNEKGIRILYSKKSDLIKGWAKCEEELGTPVNEIARKIVNELIRLDCKRGVNWAYDVLDSKYKRDYKRDLSGLGNEEAEANVGLPTIESTTAYLELPHPEDVSKELMSAEDLQENEEFLAHQAKELKRRQQEYIDVMNRKRVARIGQKESEIERTPRPYDAVYGEFYQELVGLPLEHNPGGLAADLRAFAKTIEDAAVKIAYFPPENKEEDKRLAEGIRPWRALIQWLNEHWRPYADEKFSQSLVDWWKTEKLNNSYGKHAAAVMSKVATLTGSTRSLTREQVGDVVVKVAEKAINFHGALQLADKAFKLMQEDMPSWHRRRLAPAIATRKENVSGKLSESAFGSSK